MTTAPSHPIEEEVFVTTHLVLHILSYLILATLPLTITTSKHLHFLLTPLLPSSPFHMDKAHHPNP
eukprot:scaffold4164_cov190-Ochromonas_danica.AAC.2